MACPGLPTARKLARLFITHIYKLHGVPWRLISDQGVQFTAKFWRNFLIKIGLSQGLSSAFYLATNGSTERANTMIEQYIRCYVKHQQADWADLLPFVEVAYSNIIHSSTGYTLFQVATGVGFVPIPECPQPIAEGLGLREWISHMQSVWEVVRKALHKARETYKYYADKK